MEPVSLSPFTIKNVLTSSTTTRTLSSGWGAAVVVVPPPEMVLWPSNRFSFSSTVFERSYGSKRAFGEQRRRCGVITGDSVLPVVTSLMSTTAGLVNLIGAEFGDQTKV